MTLRTGDAYRESLRKLRPNVHKWGERVEDLTTHPATRLHVQSVAASFDAATDAERAPIFTATSHLTAKPAHRWNTLMRTAEDVLGNARMKRAQFRFSGTCQGATCVGWTALNALWAVTHELDAELGTDYHARVRDYLREVEDRAHARLARLVEWLTIGGGVPGCMHGGGSPDGARLAIKGLVGWEGAVADARRIAGLPGPAPGPR